MGVDRRAGPRRDPADHEWIDTPAGLTRLLAELDGEPLIGLDTEFHRERTYFPKVALIQLAWPGGLALIDTLIVDPLPLSALLADDTTIIMHAASQDLDALDRVCGVAPRRLFDTQVAAGFVGYRGPSLVALVEGELGFNLPKGDRLADWLHRPLGAAQRRYAAADVVHLLDLAASLRRKLEVRGRLAWAEDECEELRQRALVRRDPDDAWWRIKEARQLRGRAVQVAQTLAAWRERAAVETDQPVRFILPDLALVSIAQRPADSIDDLRAVRGLDGRHLRGGQAEEILGAVKEGLALKRSEVRMPPLRKEIERDLRPAATLSSALVGQLARDLHIDPTLLATRADLEDFLRGAPDARLLHGWRAEVVGDRLRRLVSGEAAVVFDGRGGLTLEERSRRPLA
ncbi:MAG: ribonuclease D [Acidimicrobiales bacterium]